MLKLVGSISVSRDLGGNGQNIEGNEWPEGTFIHEFDKHLLGAFYVPGAGCQNKADYHQICGNFFLLT